MGQEEDLAATRVMLQRLVRKKPRSLKCRGATKVRLRGGRSRATGELGLHGFSQNTAAKMGINLCYLGRLPPTCKP